MATTVFEVVFCEDCVYRSAGLYFEYSSALFEAKKLRFAVQRNDFRRYLAHCGERRFTRDWTMKDISIIVRQRAVY
jgi:hypothetical protein